MTKEIICTVCPMGCHILVEGEGEQVTSITGYTCRRGEEYGRQEFSHPVRILTTTVKTDSEAHPLLPVRSSHPVRILTTTVKTDSEAHPLLPVRSSCPVPKELLAQCMEEIRKKKVTAPVKRYDVIIENICGCGADIVASGEIR